VPRNVVSLLDTVHPFPRACYFFYPEDGGRPLPWSNCQSSWLQIQRSRVRFPALSDFLRSSGSGTGSTHPREYTWDGTWKKKLAAPV
jgi:hypothetical protein